MTPMILIDRCIQKTWKHTNRTSKPQTNDNLVKKKIYKLTSVAVCQVWPDDLVAPVTIKKQTVGFLVDFNEDSDVKDTFHC